MSDSDLRPTPSGSSKPEPIAGPPRRWWQTLKARIGILVLIALLGVGLAVFRGVWKSVPQPFSLLSESERPARLEAMHRAIQAFYANPSQDAGQTAWNAIFAYRRTFADADPGTLLAGSEKFECGTPRECDMLSEQSKQRQAVLVGPIMYGNTASLSSATIEYHIKVVTDLAMERRIAASVPTDGFIRMDLKALTREKELEGVRARFFSKLDEAVQAFNASKDQSAVPGLIEYLKVYADAAKDTWREIVPGRECLTIYRTAKDVQLCEAAIRAVNSASSRDQATRVTVAKQALKDRDAPRDVLQASITQIFR
jgi:hypothetical protein